MRLVTSGLSMSWSHGKAILAHPWHRRKTLSTCLSNLEVACSGCPRQVRDVYWTARNFRNRVADFLRYRRVTAGMDQRFPDASPEDLARADGVFCALQPPWKP